MTDACQTGVTAVLFNLVNGNLHTLSCASAALTQAEQQCSQFEWGLAWSNFCSAKVSEIWVWAIN